MSPLRRCWALRWPFECALLSSGRTLLHVTHVNPSQDHKDWRLSGGHSNSAVLACHAFPQSLSAPDHLIIYQATRPQANPELTVPDSTTRTCGGRFTQHMFWGSSALSLQAGMRQKGGKEAQIPQDVLFPLHQSRKTDGQGTLND